MEEHRASEILEYSIIIPVFNSERTLAELCSRLHHVLNSLGERHEIILIDDASKDRSWLELESIEKKIPNIKLIQLLRNVGQFRAIMCGFNHASGNFILTMDDDLQNPPEEIPKLIQAMQADEDMDCIIGVPREKKHSCVRRWGSALLNVIHSFVLNKPIDLRMSSFRIIRRTIVQEMIKNKSVNVTLGPLLLLTTRRISNVVVLHQERKYGSTNYGLLRILKTFLDNILNYTTLPLYLVGFSGILISLMSFGFATYVVLRKLYSGFSISGWASLITMISFFSGLILFSLGIIGEYLIRIIRELGTESQFIIRKKKF